MGTHLLGLYLLLYMGKMDKTARIFENYLFKLLKYKGDLIDGSPFVTRSKWGLKKLVPIC